MEFDVGAINPHTFLVVFLSVGISML